MPLGACNDWGLYIRKTPSKDYFNLLYILENEFYYDNKYSYLFFVRRPSVLAHACVRAFTLFPSPRSASEQVSQRLEACEDELKDLESALEELTEAFGQAAETMRLENDEFG